MTVAITNSSMLRRNWPLASGVWPLALYLLTSTACTGDFAFIDLWLTHDQQGRYDFERGRYAEAAERFEDPMWKGIAYYRNGDWEGAIDQFARLETAEAYFNLGNAYAHSENYELAVEAYDQALAQRPDWAEALENRELVAARIAEEPPPPEEGQADPTFAPDEIKFDEKGEKGEKGEMEQALFSEDQLAEMWLRGVRSTPADFLRMKFAFQAAQETARENNR
jgi:Ca-activated chloride channel family protein